MHRYEMGDEHWELIRDMFPGDGRKGGKPWKDHRTVVNGVFWILHSGAPWRDLPERYGNWRTVWHRFNLYRRTGFWDRILERLQAKLDAAGKIDWDLWCIDGTVVRASRSAAGAEKKAADRDGEPADHALGRSRGGYGTKLHLVTDGNGLPLAVKLTAGQVHETKAFEPAMNAVRVLQPRGRPRSRPKRLAGDKGYAAKWIRDWLKRRKVVPVIPTKANETPDPAFDREAYRRRNVVERCVNRLKELRRIGTRYEKLAVNYLAMVKAAMIERCLRLLV